MKNRFDVTEEEKKRIIGLVNEQKGLLNEAILKARKIEAKRCQLETAGANPLNPISYGPKVTHKKMTIDGDTPEVGDYFINNESRNGNLTNDWSGTNAAGSDGKSYKVTKVFALEDGCLFCYTYNFPSASGCDPAPVTPTFSCINGTCSDPGTGNGDFLSLAVCQTATNNCTPLPWTCLYEWPQTNLVTNYLQTNSHCYQWQNWNNANANPQYQNYATSQDCYNSCTPPAPSESWDCDGQGNCSDPGTGNGQYTSLNDCNNNCVVPAYRCHDCNTPCSQQLIDAGHCPYPTTAQCTAMCVDTNKWRCGRPDKFGTPRCIPCKLFELNNGTNCFNTKQECLDSDCGLIRKDPGKTDVSLSNSNVSNTNFTGDGESKELDKRSEIKELALRRIVGKIIKSRS